MTDWPREVARNQRPPADPDMRRLRQVEVPARGGIAPLGAERPWQQRPSLRGRLRVALERARRAA